MIILNTNNSDTLSLVMRAVNDRWVVVYYFWVSSTRIGSDSLLVTRDDKQPRSINGVRDRVIIRWYGFDSYNFGWQSFSFLPSSFSLSIIHVVLILLLLLYFIIFCCLFFSFFFFFFFFYFLLYCCYRDLRLYIPAMEHRWPRSRLRIRLPVFIYGN